jgi:ADP-ribose pyrophosphatase
MKHDDFDLIAKEPLYSGHFHLDRYRFRHRLFAGGWSEPVSREVLDRGGAVALLLYDPDRDAVVLIEQFRLPALLAGSSPWQIEPVAGLLDHPGEDEEAVARREAREEAGLDIAGELIPVHRILPSTGAMTEKVSIYCARVDSRRAGGVHGMPDEGEDIRVLVKPFREAMRMIRAGTIDNAHCVVALYWLAANRARLKKRWAQPAAARRKPRLAAKSSRA